MHTDTPKYVGSVGSPEDFYRPRQLDINHGGDDFPAIEEQMAETFAEEQKEFAENTEDSPANYTGISEIYVRSREVQKLVRAVDAVVADVTKVQAAGDTIEAGFLSIYNTLAEARATLADLK